MPFSPARQFRRGVELGLDPRWVGNLVGQRMGLAPIAGGWTLAELERLWFLAALVDGGRISEHPSDADLRDRRQ